MKYLAKINDSEFGKAVKIRLIEMDKTQDWLVEQVRNRTGLFFDSSYLWKILNGVVSTPGMVAAIREILDLPAE
ncbi:MAG: XRE family transcriptional regulator [bacterium]|nr:XRE family transcriptional regulator [bacterium]